MAYNPTDQRVEATLRLPLYYTGLTDAALVREQEGDSTRYELDREYGVDVPVSLEAKGITWFVVAAG